MKTFKQILFFSLLAVLTACSEDAFVSQPEVIPAGDEGSVDLISMVVPDIEMDATTRSKLYEDGDELKFTWQENDAIGVVPMSGSPLHFPIHAENAGTNTAVFDGGDWALKTSTKYAAFFPYNKEIAEKDIKSIPIDYTGQTQGNYSKYDFMATGAIQPSNGQVTFNMQRISAILKIKVKSPYNDHVRYASLIAPEPLFGIKGTLDLSSNEPVYTPEVMSKSINTDLGQDNVSWGYDYNDFVFYLMIPPTDLSGKTLKFRTNSDNGCVKEVSIAGQNFETGKAYYIDAGKNNDAFITNANLIEKAGLSSLAVNGKVNASTNREQIMQVKTIDVRGINDPTICDEIGFFRNLEKLYCSENNLTSLDISNNPNLTELSCSDNGITSLDISNNHKLTWVNLYNNQLTSLDISNNTELEDLYCSSNQLTSLDVSNNTHLRIIQCYYNQLTSLDISNNTELEYLQCYNNQLTSLDLSNNAKLSEIQCYNNQLTSLDISHNPALETLDCNNNQLSSLNVSNNPWLYELYCNSNQLTSLSVSNSTSLKILHCYSNQLTSLDISHNPALETLNCNNNQLTSLDASSCELLTRLSCHHNQLTSLDVSNCMKLESLNCAYNSFETLTITGLTNLKLLNLDNCTSLTELYCSNNGLTTLSLVNVTALTKLQCHNNYLSSLSVRTCPALTELYCYKNLMSSLDISKCTNLTKSKVRCGGQYTDSDKTEYKTLTLYARLADTTSLMGTSSAIANLNVEVIDQ